MKYTLVYIEAKYIYKKRFDIHSFCIHYNLKSLNLGIGIAYAKYDVSTLKIKNNKYAVLYTEWAGTGLLILIYETLSPKESIWGMNKFEIRERFNTYSQMPDMKDYSIQASTIHVLESLPKGYKLLKPGQIIQKNDIEYEKLKSFGGKGWKKYVSKYNIGKKVEKECSCVIISNNKKYYPKRLISPLIARKIK